MKPTYRVQKLGRMNWKAGWTDSPWNRIPALTLEWFHPNSTSHRPPVKVKVGYDPKGLFLFFQVQDRAVRAVCTAAQGPVCKDSCVEFFVEPEGQPGYFNLEINCAGTVLMSYHRYAREGVPARFYSIDPARLKVMADLPRYIPVEIRKALTWQIRAFVPWSVFRRYSGKGGDMEGRVWRANFYKIASHTSKPHWACWAPIGRVLSFHQPRYFGNLAFEGKDSR